MYADVKNTQNKNIESNDSKRKNYIESEIKKKFKIIPNTVELSDNVYTSGKSKSIFIQTSKKENIKSFKFNKDLIWVPEN